MFCVFRASFQCSLSWEHLVETADRAELRDLTCKPSKWHPGESWLKAALYKGPEFWSNFVQNASFFLQEPVTRVLSDVFVQCFMLQIIHSGKLTWQWKMDPLKMYFLLNMGIFHCYVSLPQGTSSLPNTTNWTHREFWDIWRWSWGQHLRHSNCQKFCWHLKGLMFNGKLLCLRAKKPNLDYILSSRFW